MKKIIYILIGLFALGSYAQGGPKVDVIKFRGEVSTTVRDTFDVPTGETWLIWNESNNRLEIAQSNDVWKLLLTEDLFSWPNVWTGSSNTFETNVVIGEEGVSGGGLDLVGNIPVSGFNIQFYNNDYDTPLGIVGYNTTEGLKLENNTSSKSLKLLNSGLLTYNGQMTVSDDAYDATDWNGNLEVPTKNAVRDEMELKADESSLGDLAVKNTVDTADIDNDAVTSAKIADGTIAVADLSATGSASSSTYLRGDNTWATVSGTDDQTAAEVSYDNTDSSLSASNVKTALDELDSEKGGKASDNVWTGDNDFGNGNLYLSNITSSDIWLFDATNEESPSLLIRMFDGGLGGSVIGNYSLNGSSTPSADTDLVDIGFLKSGLDDLATIDASGFSGNLDTDDDTLQELADAVDGISGGGTDDQTGAEVLLTGYSKPGSTSAIADTDNVNQALGKLEKGLDGTVKTTGDQTVEGVKKFTRSTTGNTAVFENTGTGEQMRIQMLSDNSLGNPIGFTFGSFSNVDGNYYSWSQTADLETSPAMLLDRDTGDLYVSSLEGVGDRMVIADEDGFLSTQAIPGGGSGIQLHPDSPVTIDSLYVGTESEIAAAGLGTDVLSIATDPSPAATFSGTEIPLDGYYTQDNTSIDTGAWTLNATVKNGASFDILINQASEPTITGATEIPGTAGFSTNTLSVIKGTVIQGTVYYYFLDLE